MLRTSRIARRHEQVSLQLRDDLAAGRYGQEGRLPSEAQLARQFSVSRPTVARALQSLVEAGLVERRAGSGTFAKPGSVKIGAAPATRVFALLMPDLWQYGDFSSHWRRTCQSGESAQLQSDLGRLGQAGA